jgi:hypothetical protein
MKRLICVFCLAIVLPSLRMSSQLLCIGEGGKPCTELEAKEMCAERDTPPNLVIAKPVKLAGILIDEFGLPVVFERDVPEIKTIIQIRNPKTNAILYSAPLQQDGRFDLGSIPAGSFRLLAVWMKGGELRPLPLADQPKPMSCPDGTVCTVKAIIHFHGTDDLADVCPPK